MKLDPVTAFVREHPLVIKIWFPIVGLVYILALGYASYQISDGLSPSRTIVLWVGLVFITGSYLAVAIYFLLGKQGRLLKWLQALRNLLDQRPIVNIILFSLVILIPVYLTFAKISKGVMDNFLFQCLIILMVASVASFIWPLSNPKKYFHRIISTLVFLAFIFLVMMHLITVVDYPFSLSWSEGNRFYDYSLVFGKSRYQFDGELNIPYFAPGRYGLWGIWFLFPNLPIWFHRLWNAVLWILPPVLLGWFAGRVIHNKMTRFLFSLWIALFLSQGPVYAPIVLAALFVVAFSHCDINRRVASTAFASFYAGLSRWTWMFSAGIWGVLLDIGKHYPARNGSWIRRIWPTFLIGVAGILPGMLVNWDRFIKNSETQKPSLTSSQPLLFYRLLPNETYSQGILLGIVFSTGALILLIVKLIISKKWQPSRLMMFVITVAVISTFIVGTIISTKIGGGNNLHNYDMYFITLVVVIIIILDQKLIISRNRSFWLNVLLIITILIPVFSIFQQGAPLYLPSQEDIEDTLTLVRKRVTEAGNDGEVLFIDQRQLVTFDYIQNVDWVSEYEKKYMMDQAMAGNESYFVDFYDDLKEGRFALIVSEPLYVSLRDQAYGFSEENNAWVNNVSIYVLCYYKPELTFNEFNLQLLVPRQKPGNCR